MHRPTLIDISGTQLRKKLVIESNIHEDIGRVVSSKQTQKLW